MRAAVLLTLMLAACSTAPASTPQIITQEVKVPVAVPCATPAPAADPYADTPEALRAAASIYERVQLLLAGREQRDARIAVLSAANAGCSQP